MIILNACSTVKIALDDTNEFCLFSITPNPPKDFQMHLLDGVIVNEQTESERLQDELEPIL